MAKKVGGGGKKHGNTKVKCQRYESEGRKEKNKAKRMAKQKKFEEKKRLKRERRKEGR